MPEQQTQPLVTETDIFFYCDNVSDYFRILEDDAEAWTVEPEYDFLEPTLLCWIAKNAAVTLPGRPELERLEES